MGAISFCFLVPECGSLVETDLLGGPLIEMDTWGGLGSFLRAASLSYLAVTGTFFETYTLCGFGFTRFSLSVRSVSVYLIASS